VSFLCSVLGLLTEVSGQQRLKIAECFKIVISGLYSPNSGSFLLFDGEGQPQDLSTLPVNSAGFDQCRHNLRKSPDLVLFRPCASKSQGKSAYF
jgi:hypothetical protein